MKSNDWRHKNVARYTPGNTKILYFFNCLLDGMHTTIPYICDFSRCRLNVRLTACIQPLLRGHKYRVSALFGNCLLAAHANSGFILRKIWGRLQTVVIFWGIEMLEDWHLSYHFKLFDIITIRLWHWFKCQSCRISFPGTSTSPVLFPNSLQLIFWAANKQNSWR